VVEKLSVFVLKLILITWNYMLESLDRWENLQMKIVRSKQLNAKIFLSPKKSKNEYTNIFLNLENLEMKIVFRK